jgi:hypothetical protein
VSGSALAAAVGLAVAVAMVVSVADAVGLAEAVEVELAVAVVLELAMADAESIIEPCCIIWSSGCISFPCRISWPCWARATEAKSEMLKLIVANRINTLFMECSSELLV